MTKSFDDIVSNYKDPNPEWEVLINGNNYSTNLELLEFTDSVNNPLKFTIKLSGIDSTDNIPEDAEVIVKRAGGELFRGLLKQVEPNNLNNYTFKGTGYAAELEGDIEKQYSSDVSSIVDDIILNTSVPNGKSFQTSYNFSNSPINVEDFRAKKKQLEEVNRLMGEYSVEWYTTFDGSNPVFNVTDQISFTDGGSPVDTLKTYAPNQSAKMVRQNANRNKGDFDGVIVRGYGDGDDQITYTDGNTGKGNRVLIYTDKTILTEAQAQKRAENVLATNSVSWQEIEVEPSDPNKIYGVGQELKVEAEEARLNDTYRVVELYYKFFPSEDEFESTLNLSNKPQTFVDDYKQQKEQTESQTDYSQGARNTINESNADVADKNEGTTIEFNVPQRFTEDVTGQDRTAAVYLDFSADNYKQLLQASDVTTIDDQTKVVDTTVNNFGDVEIDYSDEDEFATSDMTIQDALGLENTVEGGRTDSIGYTISSEGTFETGDTFTTGSGDIQGIYITISVISNDENRFSIPQANDKIAFYRETVDIDGDGTNESVATYNSGDGSGDLIEGAILGVDPDDETLDVLVPGGSPDGGNYNTELFAFYARVEDADGNVLFFPNDGGTSGLDIRSWAKMGAQSEIMTDFNLFIPGNFKNSTVDLEFTNLSIGVSGNTDGESFTGYYTYYTVDKVTTPNAQNGNENVQAYIANGGNNFDAGVNSDQGNETLPDSNTTTFGKLDSNELVLTKQTTSADRVRVYLNGTEIDNSPFTLSSGPPYNKEDIELTNDSNATLNKPGFNTLEVVPENSADSTDDATAYVKGNVIVDHKLDSERSN